MNLDKISNKWRFKKKIHIQMMLYCSVWVACSKEKMSSWTNFVAHNFCLFVRACQKWLPSSSFSVCVHTDDDHARWSTSFGVFSYLNVLCARPFACDMLLFHSFFRLLCHKHCFRSNKRFSNFPYHYTISMRQYASCSWLVNCGCLPNIHTHAHTCTRTHICNYL